MLDTLFQIIMNPVINIRKKKIKKITKRVKEGQNEYIEKRKGTEDFLSSYFRW